MFKKTYNNFKFLDNIGIWGNSETLNGLKMLVILCIFVTSDMLSFLLLSVSFNCKLAQCRAKILLCCVQNGYCSEKQSAGVWSDWRKHPSQCLRSAPSPEKQHRKSTAAVQAGLGWTKSYTPSDFAKWWKCSSWGERKKIILLTTWKVFNMKWEMSVRILRWTFPV